MAQSLEAIEIAGAVYGAIGFCFHPTEVKYGKAKCRQHHVAIRLNTQTAPCSGGRLIAGSPVPITPAHVLFPHPYIVRTPPYTRKSAGIRVLHWLCDALNRLGAQAWVDVDTTRGPPGADPAGGLAAGLEAPLLTPLVSSSLAAVGERPIVIHPDAFDDVGSNDPALNVRYALNYLGVMGASDQAPCDFTVAYSEAIRRRTPGCEHVLFIPGSDPRWWEPLPPSSNPSNQRRHSLLYAGKYVDYHLQEPPLHLRDCTRIARHGPDAPSTEELRELLRKGKRLYVFENTAVVAEALLCGCPVVASYNWFFRELIAEHELGLDGISVADDPASLSAAEATLPIFRLRYETALNGVSEALLRFVETTQRLAAA